MLRCQDVGRITVACTHGVFSGPAIERLRALPEIDEIVTTNTVPIPKQKRLPNMTVLSVASIFGEAMRCNTLGRSVGELFAFWEEEEHAGKRVVSAGPECQGTSARLPEAGGGAVMALRVYVESIGCKLNQSERDTLARRFALAGWDVVLHAEDADVCVVNTCAVTQGAGRTSRQRFRALRRLNPSVRLVATGLLCRDATRRRVGWMPT